MIDNKLLLLFKNYADIILTVKRTTKCDFSSDYYSNLVLCVLCNSLQNMFFYPRFSKLIYSFILFKQVCKQPAEIVWFT